MKTTALSDWLQQRLRRDGSEPVYRQLQQLLRQAVISGELPAHTRQAFFVAEARQQPRTFAQQRRHKLGVFADRNLARDQRQRVVQCRRCVGGVWSGCQSRDRPGLFPCSAFSAQSFVSGVDPGVPGDRAMERSGDKKSGQQAQACASRRR